MENKYAHYKNVERKSLSSVKNIQYKMSKPTNIVTPSRKSQKKCKDSKNLCGKAICWDYVLVGLASFPCPALWVYCKTEPSLEEEAPSVRARKLQRISGGFFARSTNPPTQTTQPTQPNHPTIHLIHHSTHSFQDVANLLPRYLIQDLNHSWSFMGSQATCFFHENGMCQGNHLYFPPGRQLWGSQFWGIHYQKFSSFNEVTFRLLLKIITLWCH